jgi:hypothetical protein
VPDEIKEAMKFVYVETVDDVLGSALDDSNSKPNRKHRNTGKIKRNGKNPSRRR